MQLYQNFNQNLDFQENICTELLFPKTSKVRDSYRDLKQ